MVVAGSVVVVGPGPAAGVLAGWQPLVCPLPSPTLGHRWGGECLLILYFDYLTVCSPDTHTTSDTTL